ncbi:MAG: hypothetical protein HY329_04710 [Chloroflexi bacterium]|nr:hypothetical protein [Chloroflexota bacterium]
MKAPNQRAIAQLAFSLALSVGLTYVAVGAASDLAMPAVLKGSYAVSIAPKQAADYGSRTTDTVARVRPDLVTAARADQQSRPLGSTTVLAARR